MRRVLLSLGLIALVASCSSFSPEAKIRDRLEKAGVKPHMAACMAEKLARKLSTDELRQLDTVAKLPKTHPGHLSLDELADRLEAIHDPHIVNVVTKAGLGCAISG